MDVGQHSVLVFILMHYNCGGDKKMLISCQYLNISLDFIAIYGSCTSNMKSINICKICTPCWALNSCWLPTNQPPRHQKPPSQMPWNSSRSRSQILKDRARCGPERHLASLFVSDPVITYKTRHHSPCHTYYYYLTLLHSLISGAKRPAAAAAGMPQLEYIQINFQFIFHGNWHIKQCSITWRSPDSVHHYYCVIIRA